MFQLNESFLGENGNVILSEDLANNSSLLIDEIGKKIGFNYLY